MQVILLVLVLIVVSTHLALVWRGLWPRPVIVAPARTDDAFMARVRELVTEQDARWPDRSGQAKDHQVRAVLMKEFPGVRGRTISRAILDALDGQ